MQCVACALVDLDGQVSVVVDVLPEVYKLVRFVLHLTGCLYAEYGGGLWHPLRMLRAPYTKYVFLWVMAKNGSSRCFLAKKGCTLKTIAAESVVGRI